MRWCGYRWLRTVCGQPVDPLNLSDDGYIRSSVHQVADCGFDGPLRIGDVFLGCYRLSPLATSLSLSPLRVFAHSARELAVKQCQQFSNLIAMFFDPPHRCGVALQREPERERWWWVFHCQESLFTSLISRAKVSRREMTALVPLTSWFAAVSGRGVMATTAGALWDSCFIGSSPQCGRFYRDPLHWPQLELRANFLLNVAGIRWLGTVLLLRSRHILAFSEIILLVCCLLTPNLAVAFLWERFRSWVFFADSLFEFCVRFSRIWVVRVIHRCFHYVLGLGNQLQCSRFGFHLRCWQPSICFTL